MPTEAELRSFLQETGPTDAGNCKPIDAALIVRRAHRRRLPKQLAIGGTVTLAAAGIGVASLQGLRSVGPSGATSTLGSEPDTATETTVPVPAGSADPGIDEGVAIDRAPASKLNLCGGSLADVAPSVTGLVASTSFADGAPADGSRVDGTVTLTNTGTERVSGATAATPAITLSQDGIVLWHSNGPMIAMAMLVDLGPGESVQYDASFLPVRCEVEDDSGEAFRDDLPALAAGAYQVSAALDITLDAPVNDSPMLELVTGPLAQVTIG